METVDLFLAKPIALFIVLVIGATIGIMIEQFFARLEKAKWRAYWQGRKKRAKPSHPILSARQRSSQEDRDPVKFAADQLAAVMGADFSGRPVFNKGELRLFRIIEASLAQSRPDWRVLGQVSLGEILGSGDKDAYLAINSKRVDLLIVDEESQPVQVIEFHGSGHHLGNTAAARDAVKKEALRRARIGHCEIKPGDTPSHVRAIIAKLSPAKAA